MGTNRVSTLQEYTGETELKKEFYLMKIQLCLYTGHNSLLN